MGKKRVDWQAIKEAYVFALNRPSLDSLAQQHGINASNLRRRAAREDWLTQANLFTTEWQQKTADRKSTLLATEKTKLDSDCLKLARAMLATIARSLGEIRGKKPVPVGQLLALTNTLAKAQQVGRAALGDAVPETSVTVNLGDVRSLSDEQLRRLAEA